MPLHDASGAGAGRCCILIPRPLQQYHAMLCVMILPPSDSQDVVATLVTCGGLCPGINAAESSEQVAVMGLAGISCQQCQVIRELVMMLAQYGARASVLYVQSMSRQSRRLHPVIGLLSFLPCIRSGRFMVSVVATREHEPHPPDEIFVVEGWCSFMLPLRAAKVIKPETWMELTPDSVQARGHARTADGLHLTWFACSIRTSTAWEGQDPRDLESCW